MMFAPPFFYSPYSRRYPRYPTHEPTSFPQPLPKPVQKQEAPKEKKENKPEYSPDNSQVFNIMGITLHFDDILIICLLFFLYSEGVQDEMLFIALILLLLS